ncbi:hypothetical protein BDW_02375 [Bdellovibrio bacteriovorus W]|nr:hypothetical protein BDW_02375 [Bdellovibrio bacteriovorus W]
MNYNKITFIAKVDVTDCREEINQNNNKKEYRVYFPFGSCKSDIMVSKRGVQKFVIHPMAIEGRFYIRILKKIKNRKSSKE